MRSAVVDHYRFIVKMFLFVRGTGFFKASVFRTLAGVRDASIY